MGLNEGEKVKKGKEVKIYKKLCISVSLCLGMMMGACTSDDGVGELQPKGLMPVLFSAGNMEAAITRATSAPYMPENSRFVCSMFFHAGAKDDNDTEFYPVDGAPTPEVNMTTAWLKINNTFGNAVYRQNTFSDPTEADENGFDKAANCFYWQNRLEHVFVAVADNNHLAECPTFVDNKLICNLTRTDEINEMAKQPDPIVAWIKMSPAGATPEANRVKLFFKHQFAQIQVNIKGSGDASATISRNQIKSVELLGVAQKGTVDFGIDPDGSMKPLSYENPETTSTPLAMFERNESDVPLGYLKSFEGIAYGRLYGIRITWAESEADDARMHIATYKGMVDTNKDYLQLESGIKYVYNIELRRSVIAQVTPEILPWEVDSEKYTAEGTIKD